MWSGSSLSWSIPQMTILTTDDEVVVSRPGQDEDARVMNDITFLFLRFVAHLGLSTRVPSVRYQRFS
jgi:hypothetical protein